MPFTVARPSRASSSPPSVTSIGDCAFCRCTSLNSVAIPSSVTSIGHSAFYGCTSLNSVAIPSSVTSIEGYTFYGCTSLKSVAIPSSVTSIGSSAFYDCTSLKSVTIPSSVRSIAPHAFHSNANGMDVFYAGTADDFEKITYGLYGVSYDHLHTFEFKSATSPVNCAPGMRAYYLCSCGKAFLKPDHSSSPVSQSDLTIPSTEPHKPVMIPVVASTYKTAGLTAGSKCSVCGEILKAQKAVPHSFKLDKKTLTFNAVFGWDSRAYIGLKDGVSRIKSVKSSKSSVARAKVEYKWNSEKIARYQVCVEPKKVGTTTLTVKDEKGNTQKIKVVVKKSYFKKRLRVNTSGSIESRSSTAHIISVPGAKISFSFGGRVCSAKTNKNGYATIRLAREGYSGDKFKVVARKWGCKAVYSGKVGKSSTSISLGRLDANSYMVRAVCYNVRKGDVAILRIGNETHSARISDVDSYGRSNITFYTNKALWNYRTISTSVKASNGRFLYSSGRQNINWSGGY